MSNRRASTLIALFRNLIIAALIYTLVFGIIQIVKTPSRSKGKLGIPAVLDKSGPASILRTTKSGVQIKFAASSTSVTLNPHANVFNRPPSAVIPRDDYLGPRPHVDVEADYDFLVNECRGTYLGTEKIKNVFDCLHLLEHDSDKYFRLPLKDSRASRRSPKEAEYANSDRHDNTRNSYESPESATLPSKQSIGTCPGPIVPYHIYWTGLTTWRLEMFVKSYLYTQNLACSRLHIWVDQDRWPNAIAHTLNKDALFARFLPFVERGDIVLKGWNFPTRIPLPKNVDNTDGIGYYKTPQKANSKGETNVADGVIQDSDGQQWLVLSSSQLILLPQAVSDAVRFIILHLHGGVFLDVDILLLRDMRPLLLPKQHNFVGRWASHPHPGDFSTSIISLSANSSLSSYLLRGGVRMGLNFHPKVVGRMTWKDGRDQELVMFESAFFDPMWTEANWGREGRCTLPCLKDYAAVFKGKANDIKDEWESYDGPQLKEIDLHNPPSPKAPVSQSKREHDLPVISDEHIQSQMLLKRDEHNSSTSDEWHPIPTSFLEEDELRLAGAIADYRPEEDRFPPNNRTLSNFYRGAWAYNVHNSWLRHPEPSSWLSVIQKAHDGFFAGERVNMYGEMWNGPDLMPYYYWPEYL